MPKTFQTFFSTLSFLTTLRIPQKWCGEIQNLESGLHWYPVAGLVVGAVLGLALFLGSLLFGPLVASVWVLFCWLAITGGFHMDGVADTADAFFSSRPRDRMLEIMKDSRTGAMGVMAIATVLLFKVAAIAELPEALRYRALLVAPVLGRTASVFLMHRFPYARANGLSSIYLEGRSHKGLWGALAIALVLAICFFREWGLLLFMGVLVYAQLFGAWCKTKIDGFAGDNLGAVVETGEITSLLILLAILNSGVSL